LQEKGIVLETVTTVEESLIGRYLVILYDGLPYPGVVLDVDEDDVEVKVFILYHFIKIFCTLFFSKLKKKRLKVQMWFTTEIYLFTMVLLSL